MDHIIRGLAVPFKLMNIKLLESIELFRKRAGSVKQLEMVPNLDSINFVVFRNDFFKIFKANFYVKQNLKVKKKN